MKGQPVLFVSALLTFLYTATAGRTDDTDNCKTVIVGAGAGGVYAAWRLANDDPRHADEICIFERLDRIGGRMFQANCDNVPEMCELGLTAELGATNWNKGARPVTHALISDVFDLPYECWVRTDDPECTIRSGGAEVRGKFLTAEEVGYSENWPYNFRRDEQFNADEGTRMYSPFNMYRELFEDVFNFDDVHGIASSDPAEKWSAFTELMNFARNYTNDGIGSNLLTAEALFRKEHSAEMVSAHQDTFFPRSLSQSLSYPLYDYIWIHAYDFATDFDYSPQYTMQHPYPYNTFVHSMLDEFQGKGGRIFYEHTLTAVHKQRGSRKFRIKIKKGRGTDGEIELRDIDVLFLNMNNRALKLLDMESVIFTAATDAATETLWSVVEEVSSKIAIYYSDAWWKRHPETSDGLALSSDRLGRVRWADIPLPGPIEDGGMLLASYLFGSDSLWAFNYADKSNDVLTVLRRENRNSRQLLDTLHERVMDFVGNMYNVSGIERPEFGVLSRWDGPHWECVTHFGPSNVSPGEDANAILKPLEDDNMKLFIVDVDFSHQWGVAEGSLHMAERALSMLGLSRPDFIEEHYYDAVVVS